MLRNEPIISLTRNRCNSTLSRVIILQLPDVYEIIKMMKNLLNTYFRNMKVYTSRKYEKLINPLSYNNP